MTDRCVVRPGVAHLRHDRCCSRIAERQVRPAGPRRSGLGPALPVLRRPMRQLVVRRHDQRSVLSRPVQRRIEGDRGETRHRPEVVDGCERGLLGSVRGGSGSAVRRGSGPADRNRQCREQPSPVRVGDRLARRAVDGGRRVRPGLVASVGGGCDEQHHDRRDHGEDGDPASQVDANRRRSLRPFVRRPYPSPCPHGSPFPPADRIPTVLFPSQRIPAVGEGERRQPNPPQWSDTDGVRRWGRVRPLRARSRFRRPVRRRGCCRPRTRGAVRTRHPRRGALSAGPSARSDRRRTR